ncbi:MAG: hypothetical protein PHE51_01035 [Eubacteriales bacterium]|nr:hypothetical protein [Eubacteriales bacterium]
MDNLIFDRERPVPLNFEDLNRIESWTQYLYEYLRSLGYVISVHTTTWEIKSIPWRAEIDRVRQNIITLHETFILLPDWREISFTNSLDFEQVNVLEWDLQLIYNWLSRMVSAFWYSGELYSGEV